MNYIEQLKFDIDFFEEHEDSLLNEVKHKKLCDILERIRGVSYVVGRTDEQLVSIHKYVSGKIKEITNEMDETDELTIYADGVPINKPLLTIELQNESSVPKVFYKGEQIGNLRELRLDWDTNTNVTYGGLTYAIKYAEKGNKYPVNHRIEREVKGHAL